VVNTDSVVGKLKLSTI